MATTINLNEIIILNSYPDRYEVNGWDYDPQNPDVPKIKFNVTHLGTTGEGTQIDINDIIVLNSYPDEYKVTGWDYSAEHPIVTSITFDVELQS